MRRSTTRKAALIVIVAALALSSSPPIRASIVRGYIYRPDPMPAKIDWRGVPAPEQVTVHTDDALDILGYRWRASTQRHSTMIFFHGNAGNRYIAALLAAPLRRPDAEIIIASYRGYGGNPGRPTEAGLYRDGAAFLRYARRSHPERIYLFGFSLGAAVALRLAADQPVDGVITLGAFSSLGAVAPRWAKGLLPDRFDNLASVRRLRVPFLILHGSADAIVPFDQALQLKTESGDRARLALLRNASHDLALDVIAALVWSNIETMVPTGTGQPAAALTHDRG